MPPVTPEPMPEDMTMTPVAPALPGPGETPAVDPAEGAGGDTATDPEGAGGAGPGADMGVGETGGAGGEMSMDEEPSMGGSMSDPEPGGDAACMKGTTSGNEVVFIGESFIAASQIAADTSALARENGSLQQGESYLDFSVSGTRLGDGAIPRQYEQAAASNPIRFVLMNGGGNDCLQAGDPNSPIPAAEALYEQMAADGVEKVVYFFYPDAAGSFGGPGSSLQTCLEEYRPKIKAVCDGLTAPKCYWLDLAETEWDGNEDAFTSDGIHPNAQGSQVTAQAIWDTMVENCVAQ